LMRSWSPDTLTVVGAQSMPAAASKEQRGEAFYIHLKAKQPFNTGLAHHTVGVKGPRRSLAAKGKTDSS
jgi:hypothetical protein